MGIRTQAVEHHGDQRGGDLLEVPEVFRAQHAKEQALKRADHRERADTRIKGPQQAIGVCRVGQHHGFLGYLVRQSPNGLACTVGWGPIFLEIQEDELGILEKDLRKFIRERLVGQKERVWVGRLFECFFAVGERELNPLGQWGEEGLDELFFVLEIAVKAAFGDVCFTDDLIDGDIFDALRQKEGETGLAKLTCATLSVLIALAADRAWSLAGDVARRRMKLLFFDGVGHFVL